MLGTFAVTPVTPRQLILARLDETMTPIVVTTVATTAILDDTHGVAGIVATQGGGVWVVGSSTDAVNFDPAVTFPYLQTESVYAALLDADGTVAMMRYYSASAVPVADAVHGSGLRATAVCAHGTGVLVGLQVDNSAFVSDGFTAAQVQVGMAGVRQQAVLVTITTEGTVGAMRSWQLGGGGGSVEVASLFEDPREDPAVYGGRVYAAVVRVRGSVEVDFGGALSGTRVSDGDYMVRMDSFLSTRTQVPIPTYATATPNGLTVGITGGTAAGELWVCGLAPKSGAPTVLEEKYIRFTSTGTIAGTALLGSTTASVGLVGCTMDGSGGVYGLSKHTVDTTRGALTVTVGTDKPHLYVLTRVAGTAATKLWPINTVEGLSVAHGLAVSKGCDVVVVGQLFEASATVLSKSKFDRRGHVVRIGDNCAGTGAPPLLLTRPVSGLPGSVDVDGVLAMYYDAEFAELWAVLSLRSSLTSVTGMAALGTFPAGNAVFVRFSGAAMTASLVMSFSGSPLRKSVGLYPISATKVRAVFGVTGFVCHGTTVAGGGLEDIGVIDAASDLTYSCTKYGTAGVEAYAGSAAGDGGAIGIAVATTGLSLTLGSLTYSWSAATARVTLVELLPWDEWSPRVRSLVGSTLATVPSISHLTSLPAAHASAHEPARGPLRSGYIAVVTSTGGTTDLGGSLLASGRSAVVPLHMANSLWHNFDPMTFQSLPTDMTVTAVAASPRSMAFACGHSTAAPRKDRLQRVQWDVARRGDVATSTGFTLGTPVASVTACAATGDGGVWMAFSLDAPAVIGGVSVDLGGLHERAVVAMLNANYEATNAVTWPVSGNVAAPLRAVYIRDLRLTSTCLLVIGGGAVGATMEMSGSVIVGSLTATTEVAFVATTDVGGCVARAAPAPRSAALQAVNGFAVSTATVRRMVAGEDGSMWMTASVTASTYMGLARPEGGDVVALHARDGRVLSIVTVRAAGVSTLVADGSGGVWAAVRILSGTTGVCDVTLSGATVVSGTAALMCRFDRNGRLVGSGFVGTTASTDPAVHALMLRADGLGGIVFYAEFASNPVTINDLTLSETRVASLVSFHGDGTLALQQGWMSGKVAVSGGVVLPARAASGSQMMYAFAGNFARVSPPRIPPMTSSMTVQTTGTAARIHVIIRVDGALQHVDTYEYMTSATVGPRTWLASDGLGGAWMLTHSSVAITFVPTAESFTCAVATECALLGAIAADGTLTRVPGTGTGGVTAHAIEADGEGGAFVAIGATALTLTAWGYKLVPLGGSRTRYLLRVSPRGYVTAVERYASPSLIGTYETSGMAVSRTCEVGLWSTGTGHTAVAKPGVGLMGTSLTAAHTMVMMYAPRGGCSPAGAGRVEAQPAVPSLLRALSGSSDWTAGSIVNLGSHGFAVYLGGGGPIDVSLSPLAPAPAPVYGPAPSMSPGTYSAGWMVVFFSRGLETRFVKRGEGYLSDVALAADGVGGLWLSGSFTDVIIVDTSYTPVGAMDAMVVHIDPASGAVGALRFASPAGASGRASSVVDGGGAPTSATYPSVPRVAVVPVSVTGAKIAKVHEVERIVNEGAVTITIVRSVSFETTGTEVSASGVARVCGKAPRRDGYVVVGATTGPSTTYGALGPHAGEYAYAVIVDRAFDVVHHARAGVRVSPRGPRVAADGIGGFWVTTSTAQTNLPTVEWNVSTAPADVTGHSAYLTRLDGNLAGVAEAWIAGAADRAPVCSGDERGGVWCASLGIVKAPQGSRHGAAHRVGPFALPPRGTGMLSSSFVAHVVPDGRISTATTLGGSSTATATVDYTAVAAISRCEVAVVGTISTPQSNADTVWLQGAGAALVGGNVVVAVLRDAECVASDPSADGDASQTCAVEPSSLFVMPSVAALYMLARGLDGGYFALIRTSAQARLFGSNIVPRTAVNQINVVRFSAMHAAMRVQTIDWRASTSRYIFKVFVPDADGGIWLGATRTANIGPFDVGGGFVLPHSLKEGTYVIHYDRDLRTVGARSLDFNGIDRPTTATVNRAGDLVIALVTTCNVNPCPTTLHPYPYGSVSVMLHREAAVLLVLDSRGNPRAGTAFSARSDQTTTSYIRVEALLATCDQPEMVALVSAEFVGFITLSPTLTVSDGGPWLVWFNSATLQVSRAARLGTQALASPLGTNAIPLAQSLVRADDGGFWWCGQARVGLSGGSVTVNPNEETYVRFRADGSIADTIAVKVGSAARQEFKCITDGDGGVYAVSMYTESHTRGASFLRMRQQTQWAAVTHITRSGSIDVVKRFLPGGTGGTLVLHSIEMLSDCRLLVGTLQTGPSASVTYREGERVAGAHEAVVTFYLGAPCTLRRRTSAVVPYWDAETCAATGASDYVPHTGVSIGTVTVLEVAKVNAGLLWLVTRGGASASHFGSTSTCTHPDTIHFLRVVTLTMMVSARYCINGAGIGSKGLVVAGASNSAVVLAASFEATGSVTYGTFTVARTGVCPTLYLQVSTSGAVQQAFLVESDETDLPVALSTFGASGMLLSVTTEASSLRVQGRDHALTNGRTSTVLLVFDVIGRLKESRVLSAGVGGSVAVRASVSVCPHGGEELALLLIEQGGVVDYSDGGGAVGTAGTRVLFALVLDLNLRARAAHVLAQGAAVLTSSVRVALQSRRNTAWVTWSKDEVTRLVRLDARSGLVIGSTSITAAVGETAHVRSATEDGSGGAWLVVRVVGSVVYGTSPPHPRDGTGGAEDHVVRLDADGAFVYTDGHMHRSGAVTTDVVIALQSCEVAAFGTVGSGAVLRYTGGPAPLTAGQAYYTLHTQPRCVATDIPDEASCARVIGTQLSLITDPGAGAMSYHNLRLPDGGRLSCYPVTSHLRGAPVPVLGLGDIYIVRRDFAGDVLCQTWIRTSLNDVCEGLALRDDGDMWVLFGVGLLVSTPTDVFIGESARREVVPPYGRALIQIDGNCKAGVFIGMGTPTGTGSQGTLLGMASLPDSVLALGVQYNGGFNIAVWRSAPSEAPEMWPVPRPTSTGGVLLQILPDGRLNNTRLLNSMTTSALTFDCTVRRLVVLAAVSGTHNLPGFKEPFTQSLGLVAFHLDPHTFLFIGRNSLKFHANSVRGMFKRPHGGVWICGSSLTASIPHPNGEVVAPVTTTGGDSYIVGLGPDLAITHVGRLGASNGMGSTFYFSSCLGGGDGVWVTIATTTADVSLVDRNGVGSHFDTTASALVMPYMREQPNSIHLILDYQAAVNFRIGGALYSARGYSKSIHSCEFGFIMEAKAGEPITFNNVAHVPTMLYQPSVVLYSNFELPVLLPNCAPPPPETCGPSLPPCERSVASTILSGAWGGMHEQTTADWHWEGVRYHYKFSALKASCLPPPIAKAAMTYVSGELDAIHAAVPRSPDTFATSVAADGVWLVVGSLGTVFIYRRQPVEYLFWQIFGGPTTTGASWHFGATLALRVSSGVGAVGVLVVGAPQASSGAFWPAEDMSATGVVERGAVVVYELVDATSGGVGRAFVQVARLLPPGALAAKAHFGAAVGVSRDGNAIIIGMPGDARSAGPALGYRPLATARTASTGLAGRAESGGAVVYARSQFGADAQPGDGVWSPTAWLYAPSGAAGCRFGAAVAIDGVWPDYTVVSATVAEGTVYVYSMVASDLGRDATIAGAPKAIDKPAGDAAVSTFFGASVGVVASGTSGTAPTVIAVGAPTHPRCAGGMVAPAAVSTGGTGCVARGAVLLYEPVAGVWTLSAVFKGDATGTGGGSTIGASVDAKADGTVVHVAVGGPGDATTGVGVAGVGRVSGSVADGGVETGAGWILKRTGAGVWSADAYAKAPHTRDAGGQFGAQVAVAAVPAVGVTAAHVRACFTVPLSHAIPTGVNPPFDEISTTSRGRLYCVKST